MTTTTPKFRRATTPDADSSSDLARAVRTAILDDVTSDESLARIRGDKSDAVFAAQIRQRRRFHSGRRAFRPFAFAGAVAAVGAASFALFFSAPKTVGDGVSAGAPTALSEDAPQEEDRVVTLAVSESDASIALGRASYQLTDGDDAFSFGDDDINSFDDDDVMLFAAVLDERLRAHPDAARVRTFGTVAQ